MNPALDHTEMNPPLTTGVLTFHRCINYGSYWQARCLAEGLRARGRDAVLLDHDSRRVNFAEWRCALRPTLPTPVPKSDRPLYRCKICKFFQAFESLPLSPRFDLEDPAGGQGYDAVVVGSDEVWNLCHPWYGGSALFYGEGVRARRLISYAASFGNYDASGGLDPAWAGRLRNFSALSVRDENSRRLIQDTLGLDPTLVLDPCLQFPLAPEGVPKGPPRPFVAVYGHNFSPWFAREVRRWADARGLPLVSIGYRNDWADAQWISAGPQEFAHCIAQAEAVATNFFHGCIFALQNAKPFVGESSYYRTHKIQNLMATVGGEQHLVWEDTPHAVYEACLCEALDPAILQRIEHLRRASDAYLERALA